jgi:hypothetical protein
MGDTDYESAPVKKLYENIKARSDTNTADDIFTNIFGSPHFRDWTWTRKVKSNLTLTKMNNFVDELEVQAARNMEFGTPIVMKTKEGKNIEIDTKTAYDLIAFRYLTAQKQK